MTEKIDVKDIVPKPPTILLKAAREKYYEIAQALIEDNNWENGYDIALLALCINYQRWIAAEREIRRQKSLTFETDSGYRQQIPEISIANNAMKNMLNFIKEFGLTPKERANLKGIIQDNEGLDEELEGMIS